MNFALYYARVSHALPFQATHTRGQREKSCTDALRQQAASQPCSTNPDLYVRGWCKQATFALLEEGRPKRWEEHRTGGETVRLHVPRLCADSGDIKV